MILFKKSVIVFLLILFGFNIIAQFSENIFSELVLIRNRYYVENNDEVVAFKLPIAEWISLENKKEIVYKNIYFDIKKVVVTDNEVTLFAIEDSYENILKFLQKSLAVKNKKESEKKRLKSKRIADLYCIIFIENKTPLNFTEKCELNNQMQSFFHSCLIKPSIKPPIDYI